MFFQNHVFSERGLPVMIRQLRDLARDCDGTALVEFAALLPLLLALMVGIAQMGLIFSNYIMLTNATGAGALLFSQSRSLPNPYTTTVSQIQTAASPPLTQASLTITTKVGNTACTSDSGCLALLVAGAQASVTVTYPCTLLLPAASLSWLQIFNTNDSQTVGGNTTFNFCPLTTTLTEYVQ
jgi:Flp pilus assembly protein TadG